MQCSLKISLFAVPCMALLTSTAFATPILMPMENQSGTFTGNVRGYWFTAPVAFRLVALQVPTTASSAAQSIEVLRLNAIPPTFSGTTTSFTRLFRTVNNNTTGFVPININIQAGEIIGILGQRSNVTSYGANNYVTNIFGNSVTLQRFGSQQTLAAGPVVSVFRETNANPLGRVNLEYDVATPEPATLALTGTALIAVGLIRRRKTA